MGRTCRRRAGDLQQLVLLRFVIFLSTERIIYEPLIPSRPLIWFIYTSLFPSILLPFFFILPIFIYLYVYIHSCLFNLWNLAPGREIRWLSSTHTGTHTDTHRPLCLCLVRFPFLSFSLLLILLVLGVFLFCSLTNRMESICCCLFLSWWLATDSCSTRDHVISATELIDKKIIKWKTLPTILINLLVSIDRMPFCFLECNRRCQCPIWLIGTRY